MIGAFTIDLYRDGCGGGWRRPRAAKGGARAGDERRRRIVRVGTRGVCLSRTSWPHVTGEGGKEIEDGGD